VTDPLALFDADLTPTRSAVAEPVERTTTTTRTTSTTGTSTSEPSGSARKPTLLAVDGNALVHRAFHAYGQTTGGTRYGFFALLSVVCDQVTYDGVVVGFDCRRRSRRRERFADYKAQRPDKHEQLDASLDELPGIATDMGAHVVVADGWEADDVLASAATTAEAAGWSCAVASPDRDVLGLVSDDTIVLQVRGGARPIRTVTRSAFRRRYRVAPEQYVELAALRGDTSDNLPGIPGIGTKKAAHLLRMYPTVDDAVADPLGCRSVLGPDLGQALIDDLAAAEASVFRRNVDLMTLHRALPVDVGRCRPDATPDGIMGVLRTWRMTGLHTRMCAALCPRDDDVPAVGDADAPPEPPWAD
jgi:DNA polymerase-1